MEDEHDSNKQWCNGQMLFPHTIFFDSDQTQKMSTTLWENALKLNKTHTKQKISHWGHCQRIKIYIDEHQFVGHSKNFHIHTVYAHRPVYLQIQIREHCKKKKKKVIFSEQLKYF